MMNRTAAAGVIAALLPCLITGCSSQTGVETPPGASAPRPMPADPTQAAQAAKYQQQAEAEHRAVEARAQGKTSGATGQ